MSLFKRQHTSAQMGAIIYESLRRSLMGEGELSVASLIGNFNCREADLDEQYVGEVMVGCMFGAMLAVEQVLSHKMAAGVREGLQHEFFAHLSEQGALPEQTREWEAVVLLRFEEYQRCMENYEGFEPPWKLGRQFYWNITGSSDYIAMNIKIATLYLLAVRDNVKEVIKAYDRHLSSPHVF